MTLFWILSAAMIALALAVLAPTLLRKSPPAEGAGEKQFNIEIAREHLAELRKQHEAREISDEEFAQARHDIEMTLAEDLELTHDDDVAPARSGGHWALIAAALLIPAITIPVYQQIGSPHLIEGTPGPARAADAHAIQSPQGELPPLSELVEQLRARMDANPDNIEGWFLLGRTYMRLQDYRGAVYAFEKVVERAPNETAGLLSLADALAMQNGREVPERAVELLEKVLSLEPDSVTALWLLGNAAYDRGNNTEALDYWQRAYPLLAGEAAMQAELRQMIVQAGGEPPATVADLPTIMEAAPVAAAAPTGDAAAGAKISVEVALAPHLMEKTAPDDTLFVLARAESGPPVPLAVSRHRVAELPLQVTLSDAMAMMPNLRLSAFPRVKISAKVSKSGQAGTQPGDLLASDVVVASSGHDGSVQLLINRIAE